MHIVSRKSGNAGRRKGEWKMALSRKIFAFALKKEKQTQTKIDRLRDQLQRQ